MKHRRNRNQKGTAAITVLILAVAGLYLATRAWMSVHTVLSPPPLPASSGEARTVTLVEEAKVRDATLDEVGDPERDPFGSVRRARTQSARPSAPAAPARPQLRMILYDQLSPEVQFSVAGELSDRLRPGQSFMGWQVVSISARSCVVRKGDETITLTPRR